MNKQFIQFKEILTLFVLFFRKHTKTKQPTVRLTITLGCVSVSAAELIGGGSVTSRATLSRGTENGYMHYKIPHTGDKESLDRCG